LPGVGVLAVGAGPAVGAVGVGVDAGSVALELAGQAADFTASARADFPGAAALPGVGVLAVGAGAAVGAVGVGIDALTFTDEHARLTTDLTGAVAITHLTVGAHLTDVAALAIGARPTVVRMNTGIDTTPAAHDEARRAANLTRTVDAGLSCSTVRTRAIQVKTRSGALLLWVWTYDRTAALGTNLTGVARLATCTTMFEVAGKLDANTLAACLLTRTAHISGGVGEVNIVD
jgi:hypothetical protein